MVEGSHHWPSGDISCGPVMIRLFNIMRGEGGEMIRYAIVLAAPVVGGVLIAVPIILITELRERRQRRRMALREARHLDRAPVSGGPAPDAKDRRIAS